MIKSKEITLADIDPKYHTKNICIEAMLLGQSLELAAVQDDDICLAAVRFFGDRLEFVKNQTEEICLAAVKRDGYALRYVKKQTDEICLEAVKTSGDALRFVKNQTKEMINESLSYDHSNFLYVKADNYEYNAEQILDVFDTFYRNYHIFGGHEKYLKWFLDKLVEILILTDKNKTADLSIIVKNDLKIIFDNDKMIEISDSLAAIKQKVKMLESIDLINCGNIVNNKLKIL